MLTVVGHLCTNVVKWSSKENVYTHAFWQRPATHKHHQGTATYTYSNHAHSYIVYVQDVGLRAIRSLGGYGSQSIHAHTRASCNHICTCVYTATYFCIRTHSVWHQKKVSVPFAFRLRSVLRAICVGFALGNRAVYVGFAWGFCSMYCPFTVCLIIYYHNSGTLRVRVQGTYSARCCQRFFDYYTNGR